MASTWLGLPPARREAQAGPAGSTAATAPPAPCRRPAAPGAARAEVRAGPERVVEPGVPALRRLARTVADRRGAPVASEVPCIATRPCFLSSGAQAVEAVGPAS